MYICTLVWHKSTNKSNNKHQIQQNRKKILQQKIHKIVLRHLYIVTLIYWYFYIDEHAEHKHF